MRRRRLVRRERAAAGTPSRALDGQLRKSRLTHQGTCHRRRAMDELGASLRRISKFLRRQRVYTSTASVSRLEDGHLFTRACKLAGGHQARGTRADDQKMGSSLREHYPIPMPRAKKPSQLSAKERALLNRPDHSSEEEIKRLTTRADFAYFKIIDKVDSRATGRPRAPCLQLRTPIDDENTRQYF